MTNTFLDRFANPEFLWLLLVIPILAGWQVWKQKKSLVPLKMPSVKGFSSSPYTRLKPVLFVLRLLAIGALIIGLARPQDSSESTKTETTKGIDIVMAIDVSSSMLAKDLNPNRLVALKEVASKFIKERPNDRIGLVVYAGESYTKTPITSDKRLVLQALDEIKYGELNDGTAMGMGLATAVNRLKDSEALSKVIILLTDGVNNAGFIEPATAAELAVEYEIKTYTIGLGTNGNALSPIAYNPDGSFRYGMAAVQIDEELLQKVASLTGGKYFRATDNDKLVAIYNEINSLEKTEVETFKFYAYEEKFRPWALAALVFFLLEWILKNTLFKSFI